MKAGLGRVSGRRIMKRWQRGVACGTRGRCVRLCKGGYLPRTSTFVSFAPAFLCPHLSLHPLHPGAPAQAALWNTVKIDDGAAAKESLKPVALHLDRSVMSIVCLGAVVRDASTIIIRSTVFSSTVVGIVT